MPKRRLLRPFIFLGRILRGLFKPSPRGKIRWVSFLILILAVLAGGYDYPQKWNEGANYLNNQIHRLPQFQSINLPKFEDTKFKLGLDLQGGAHLVYQADLSEVPERERTDAMEGLRDVIERRVNALGVAEPVVQIAGEDRLVVELAGVIDINEAIQKIGETPLLEFKEENKAGPAPLTEDQQKELDEFNAAQEQKANQALTRLKRGQEPFEDLVKELSDDDQSIRDVGGDMGFISQSTDRQRFNEAEKIGLGRISQTPFQSNDGFEILRVDERRDSEKEVRASHILICYKGATRCETEFSKEEARQKIEELQKQATPENFADLARQNSTEPGAAETAGDLGYSARGRLVPDFENVLFPQAVGTISDVVETEFGFHLIHKTDERPIIEYRLRRIFFKTKKPSDFQQPLEPFVNTGLTGAQLKRAQVQFDQQTGDIQIGVEFNSEGKDLLKEVTQRNLEKPLAIFLDGIPISIPTVQSAITDGRAVITGSFTLNEAKQLAQRLNAGALPVPVSLLSQQTVEASLGRVALSESLKAALIGFALVALFMILYYRLPGLIAVISLLIYVGLVLALFKLIGVTLTLAGIAGFILSIGMAVDANILIFERMKEELRAGKGLATSIDEGFKRAWSSIRDGNITTLAGSLILFWFGTSLIKGFGLTLSIGVLMSMFSALVISRTILKLAAGWRVSRLKALYLGAKKNV